MPKFNARAEDVLASQLAELEERFVEVCDQSSAAASMRAGRVSRSRNVMEGRFECEQRLGDRLTVMRYVSQLLLGQKPIDPQSNLLQASLNRLGQDDVYRRLYERISGSSG